MVASFCGVPIILYGGLLHLSSLLLHSDCVPHKVRIYTEYHGLCPLVGIGTLPTHLTPASVPLPPEPKGRGHTRLQVRGWGSPNADDWRKSLALYLLCGVPPSGPRIEHGINIMSGRLLRNNIGRRDNKCLRSALTTHLLQFEEVLLQ